MGFQQAGGAISPCLPPGLFLQQACARPQSCGSTRGELLPNTGTHTSTHRAANSEHAFWLYPHVPCLRCTQTHSDYFCPTSSHNNSPNPFRVKTQRLWLQSPSGISCCIAKLYAIKQLNISTLLVNLLLWYCKSKKCGFFFFFMMELPLSGGNLRFAHTERHTRISYGALQAAQNRKQLEENGYREMVLLGIICWFVLFIEGMRFLSQLKI